MKITTHLLSLLLMSICVGALAFALIAQYGFGLMPCNLCLIQRVPFVLSAALAASALHPMVPPALKTRLLTLVGILLAANGAIAFYHVGVEQHWWVSAVCSGDAGAAQVSVADLMSQMSRPAEAQCDSPAWSFYGITMAAMNIPFSAGLGLLTLILVPKAARS